jgi:putative membrane protein
MNTSPLKHLGLACVLTFSALASAVAATSNSFVDDAAQGGINEVESAKLALEKSTSTDVREFATHMQEDHSKANTELMALAKKLDLEVPDEASLVAKAKTLLLEMRDESFDKAYANNQVVAHEKTVELFKKEAESSDKPELKAFAQKTLPTLEHHLEMAKQLKAKHTD